VKLILIRHGETDYNKQGKYQDHLGIDINSTGMDQAKMAAKELKGVDFDLVISSDLTRAKHTTEIILRELNSDIVALTSSKLREIDFGKWQGVDKKPEYFDQIKKDDDKLGETGESHTELYSRVLSLINNLYEKSSDKTTLIIAHGGSIRSILNMTGNTEMLKSDIPNATPIYIEISEKLQIPAKIL